MNILEKAFNNQPIIQLPNTRYVLNPLLDHTPETSYELMNSAINGLRSLTDFSQAEKIIAEEDRGGYLAAILAYKTKKSLGMVKWNPKGLKGQIGIDFRNAYTTGKMFLYGVKKNDRVILVEDLIDSGGTVVAMIKLLEKVGAKIVDIICIAEKEEMNGVQRIKDETGYSVKYLFKFNCLGKNSKIIK